MRIRTQVVITLALLAALPAAAQNFIFVSPNTAEELPLPKAEAALKSPEEQKMMDASRYALCRLGLHGDARAALGVWVGGTENSIVVQTGATGGSLDYAAAWLGRFAHQRTALVFEQKPGGRDRLYRLEFPGRPDPEVITTVEKNRLIDMTLIPGTRMTLLIAGSPDDRKHVDDAAKALNVPPRAITEYTGSERLLGDNFDREKGTRKLDAIATEFEKQHPEIERRACGVAPK